MVKEKSLLFFFTIHTLSISLKSSNTLLSPFYFLLHAQLSLGCLLFSKWLTLGCSLSFFLCSFFFLCSCTYSFCVFWKTAALCSLLPLAFLPNKNPFYSLLISRFIFPLSKGSTTGPKPTNSL